MSEKIENIEAIRIENGDSSNLTEEIPAKFMIGKFDAKGLNNPGILHTGKWIKTIKLWTNIKQSLFGVTIRVTGIWFLLYVVSILLLWATEHFTPACQKTSDNQLWKISIPRKIPYILESKANPSIKLELQYLNGSKPFLQKFDESNKNTEYLGIGSEADENGEIINSNTTVNWQTNKYEWKKGNVGQKGYFKIKDPVSKKILTAMGYDKFELRSQFDCEKFKEVNIKQFRTMEENTKAVLGILIGFYVSMTIARWWSQTATMPKLGKVAMELNAIMQIGEKGAKSLLETKKEILRLTALSYSMVMVSISERYPKKDEGLKVLKDFELIKVDEINDLVKPEVDDETYFTPNGGAMMKWGIPLNRACRIVQEEQLSGGHIPQINARQIVSGLTKMFEDLVVVADYSQRPLPACVMQAVHMVFWLSMIVGTLDNDYRNVKHFQGQKPYSMLLFLDFCGHLDELVYYILLYVWIKLATIVTNPFDGDEHFDIHVKESIIGELYAASAALNF